MNTKNILGGFTFMDPQRYKKIMGQRRDIPYLWTVMIKDLMKIAEENNRKARAIWIKE